jgi:two-component system, OmpR family, phosphate regulon response regulator PhoB
MNRTLATPPMPPSVTGDVAMSAVPTATGPAARTRILLIEDERGLTEALTWTFQREGYEVLVANDGQEGLRRAQTLLPDLIILDIMLPGLNGLEVCRELRAGERTRDIPIIILSAKAEETDQVVGFSLGADDYVTKPFSPKVLLQRIKALQRRFAGGTEPVDVVEYLRVRIDRVRHRAFADDRELDLTPTEFRLLECMLRQPGRAFTRHQLMDAAIGEGAIVLERTIDVHIKTLRRKLGTADLIETVRGVGYRFREKGE